MVNDLDYTVRLEQVFQGPMDLLLHLVREQEVEIHEIEVARVVDGFLAYLKTIQELDLELAGDFVVMAATLLAIKSRSLLPAEEVDLEDELDPRDELIERLIEYRRFRGASEQLEQCFQWRSRMEPRGYRGEVKDGEEERTLDLGELDQWDLLATYSRLLRETSGDRSHRVSFDPHPLRFYVDHVVGRVKNLGALTLRELIESFDSVGKRDAVVGSFCALLELVRLQVIQVDQPETGDDIAIALREDHADDIEEVVAATGLGDEEADGDAGDLEADLRPPAADDSAAEPEPTQNGAHEA
ncbi:MAG: segregation/condensation protein A [Planctomycetota bacterium]